MVGLEKLKAPLVLLVMGALLLSCEFFNKREETEVVARAGEAYLYKKDIAHLVTKGMTPQDSTSFVINFINKWAKKQLLLTKSKINLPDDKLDEFDRLVADYKADLYTRAYLEALMKQTQDTVVEDNELRQFYVSKKENFKLKQKLVQLRFLALPKQFLNKDEVVRRFRSYTQEDKAFLDSIAVQFTKIHLNDSIWVESSKVLSELPVLNPSNEGRYLNKSQFFELQDSLGVYLGKVTNVLRANDIAPMNYVAPNIKQIILNRRRLEQLKQLENEVLEEAIEKKDFEIYEVEVQ